MAGDILLASNDIDNDEINTVNIEMSSVLQYIHAFEKFLIPAIEHFNHRVSIRKPKRFSLSYICSPTNDTHTKL